MFNGLLLYLLLFDYIFFNGHINVQVGLIWPSVSVIQDSGSSDPDPKKVFTDPQHWRSDLA